MPTFFFMVSQRCAAMGASAIPPILTLSPMGSNPTDLLWGGAYGPPYEKRLEVESW